MEGIFVVGGIKSEPSSIEYGPPNNGASIEITFSDIESGEDESKKVKRKQPEFLPEHHGISDDEDAKIKKPQDVFKYVGYDSAKSIEDVGECIFNFTKNEDLCVDSKELQEQSKGTILLPKPNLTSYVSDIYNNLEIDVKKEELFSSDGSDHEGKVNFSILEYNEESNRLESRLSFKNDQESKIISDETTTTDDDNDNDPVKSTTHQYIHISRRKIALYSENLFAWEYPKRNGWYGCKHCNSREETLEDIKAHVIEHHRRTEVKQCPHCDVKTKVLQYHLKSHPGSCTMNRTGSAQPLLDCEQKAESKKANSKIDLNAAIFSEDVSYREYKEKDSVCRCLRCDFRSSSVEMKDHIIKNHRKTLEKRCTLCDTTTKVLIYHLRTVHNCTPEEAPLLLAEYLEKRADLRTTSPATTGTLQSTDSRPIIRKANKTKIDLNSALYSEDVSYKEYKEKRGTYRCLRCGYRDREVSKVKTHIIEHHKKSELKQCPFCDVKTRVIKYHLRHHKTPIVYSCKECDYKTPASHELENHMTTRHGQNLMVPCNICNKVYPTRRRLQVHNSRFHPKKPFLCTVCGYTARGQAALNTHMQKHMTEDELSTLYKCDTCDFQTKYFSRYKAHRKIHKWLYCDQCCAKVRTNHGLRLHMLLHKEKLEDDDCPYRCDQCDYKTIRSYNLTMHKLKHQKPEEKEYFYCYHCNFKASRKDNLKTHIAKHFQKEEVTFQCFVCDFTTTKKHLLIRHIDKHSKTKQDSP